MGLCSAVNYEIGQYIRDEVTDIVEDLEREKNCTQTVGAELRSIVRYLTLSTSGRLGSGVAKFATYNRANVAEITRYSMII